jgi:hypothetical protein
MLCCVNFSVRTFHVEKNGAVHVYGLGLEMHGQSKPATETKADFSGCFNPSSSNV